MSNTAIMVVAAAFGVVYYAQLKNEKEGKKHKKTERPYRSPVQPYVDIAYLDPVGTHRYVHESPQHVEYSSLNGMPKTFCVRNGVRYVARTLPERLSMANHR